MIPGESIARIVPMPGVPDGVELVEVRSKHGGNSRLSIQIVRLTRATVVPGHRTGFCLA